MSDMILEARLRAKDEGLVGQLNATEKAAAATTGAMGGTAAAAGKLSGASAGVATAQQDVAQQSNRTASALGNETRALDAAAAAANRKRAGMQQLGFQVQDFFVQVQGGQSVLTAFSQQASQATGALALMGSGGTAATGIMGRFMTLMGGPFGVALGVAIPLVALLSQKLFENKEAAEGVTVAADNLSVAQSLLGQMFDLNTGKIKNNTAALRDNIYSQMIAMQNKAIMARTEGEEALRKSGSGLTTPTERAWARARAYGTRDPNVIAFVEDQIAGREAEGRRFEGLGRGVAQGGITREDAGRLLEAQRKQLGDDKYFALQDYLNRAADERSANQAVKDMQSALSGNLPSGYLQPKPNKPSRKSGGSANALANFGDSAEEKIARIADSYNPAPRGLDKAFADIRTLDGLIDDLGKKKPPSFEKLIGEAQKARESVMQGLADPLDAIQQRLVPLPEGVIKAKAAIEELDGVIAVLSERKPPNWEELVARAQELKVVAAETVNGPLNDMLRSSREQREQQILILQGREREANVLARIQQLTKGQLPLNDAQRAQVEQMVDSEERVNDLLTKRQDIISVYMSTIGELRGALQDLAGGRVGDFLKNSQSMVRQFQEKLLVENFFGDSLRALEKKVRGKSPLDREIEDLAREVDGLEGEAGRSAKALKLFNEALGKATADINGGAAPRSSGQTAADSFLRALGGDATAGGDIVVTGSKQRPIGGSIMKEQTDFLREMAKAQFDPMADLFDKYLGTEFFKKLSPVFQGAYAGFFTAGPVGGILGAVKELPGLPDKLKDKLGTALEGAQTGTLVAGIGKALGLKTSTTGGQIGGAIGAATGLPGGDIAGSIIGSIVGGLFKKAKTGSATITGVDNDPVLSGNNAKMKTAAGDAASSVQGVLQQIADQLGGSVGSFNVSIGVRDGKYRVDPTGAGRTKKKGGVLDFGEDANAAIMAAAFDAIGDGGVTGLSAAVTRALKSSPDIDKALKEALKVQEVEEIVTGIGGTLERQFRAFETQAKERVRIAEQYGFDVSKIEARNAEDRAKLVEQILSSRVGSLQSLLDDLKFGNLFEGSADERRSKLLTEIAAAKSDAEKGVDGAADKLAELSRQLVETSREAYGTAGGEYAADRSNAISTAEQIIAAENERIRAAQQATLDTSKAMQTQNQLTNETNDILAEVRALLAANLGGGSAVLSSGGGRLLVERQADLR
ncbi:MAG: hypothetical protein J0H88_16235 [Sphingomonadales bacterium]|nr:hypothetical protein [Sphingomonadales bacterium]